jgi:hypothetical protein
MEGTVTEKFVAGEPNVLEDKDENKYEGVKKRVVKKSKPTFDERKCCLFET